MPDLHRGAVTYLEWDVHLDSSLATLDASVAIYAKGTAPDPIDWLPLEWLGEETLVGGTYVRTARLLVSGPAGPPTEGALVLPVGKYVNHVRVGDGPTEKLVGSGGDISVKP